MKVILLESVERLGKAGDVITVKEGFARNYLIPKNVAREATTGNMRALDSIKKKQAEKDLKLLQAVKATAERIAALSLTIPAEAGEEEKLFGSVSNEAISEALSHEGITVDKRDIILAEPIKKLGLHQVTVKLHPEVRAELKISVVKK